MIDGNFHDVQENYNLGLQTFGGLQNLQDTTVTHNHQAVHNFNDTYIHGMMIDGNFHDVQENYNLGLQTFGGLQNLKSHKAQSEKSHKHLEHMKKNHITVQHHGDTTDLTENVHHNTTNNINITNYHGMHIQGDEHVLNQNFNDGLQVFVPNMQMILL